MHLILGLSNYHPADMGTCPYCTLYIYKIRSRTQATEFTESGSELYRPSDRRLSAKLVTTLHIEEATRSARRIPTAVFSVF
jgi:hypothetical protein